MIFHGLAVILLAGAGAFGLWKASLAESGTTFLFYLLVLIVVIALIPALIYRMYALQRARYILARDGISLYWGLRHEEIPIDKVDWVGSAGADGKKITKPVLRFPGAILGMKTQQDGKLLEFLAARDTKLVMINTPERVYVISPSNEVEFLQTYRKLAEFGSLAPIESQSDYPTFLLSRSWADRPARILLISSALVALGLIAWVSLSIPDHPFIALRLNVDGSPVELVPGIRLLLIPVLNTFFFFIDLLLGLFFYRRLETRSLSYLMWASSLLTSLLFTAAVYFMLRAGAYAVN